MGFPVSILLQSLVTILLLYLLFKPYQPLSLSPVLQPYPEPFTNAVHIPASLSEKYPEILAWQQKGKYTKVFGIGIFYVDSVSTTSATDETLVIVHGFPTSSIDFKDCLNSLHSHYRRIVLADLPGFGLSQKPERFSYSIFEQSELIVEFWRQLKIDKAHILCHDMGDSVTTEILSKRDRNFLPDINITGATFTNGGLLVHMASLRISQQVLRVHAVSEHLPRFYNFAIFQKQIRSLNLVNPDLLPQRDLEIMWEMINLSDGLLRMPQLINYLNERFVFQPRWLDTISRIDIPVSMVWGQDDAVAPKEMGVEFRKVVPNQPAVQFLSYGHFPMLEDPKAFSEAVLKVIPH